MCVLGTRYHVAIGEELEFQRERGNAADTHAVSLIEGELPSATYLERFHPSVSSAVPTAFRFCFHDRALGLV